MVTTTIPGVSSRDLEEFCRTWKVAVLWLFGSGADALEKIEGESDGG